MSFSEWEQRRQERRAAFEKDPDCGQVSPYTVHCVRCDATITLGARNRGSYKWRRWGTHKTSKYHLDKGGASSPALRRSRSKRPGPQSWERRKAILEEDPDSGEVSSHSVHCVRCNVVIKLGPTGSYIRRNWEGHKNTREHLEKADSKCTESAETSASVADANLHAVVPSVTAETTAT
ncbi:hypothetical protein C8R45DRAFT_1017566 [Mycena sanguinolenta]|nr:hypothetical protein C8R45DRAFT_1017566 [Mycena sanguinolenta]